MEKLLRNDFTLTLYRLALVYLALLLLRVPFYAINADTLGGLSWSEVPGLLAGAWLFDTANICYCYGLFVLLSLLPVRWREGALYQRLLLWIWGVVSGVVVLANSADAVYFHFAKKRFTAEEFHFAQNENTGHILWKALGEYWWLALCAAGLLWGMLWSYRRARYAPTRIASPVRYYAVCGAGLAVALFAMVAGMRGGVSRAIRPITLSNAAHYATSPAKASLVLSNPFCVLRTLGNQTLSVPTYFRSEEEVAAYFSPEHRPVADSLRGPLFGKLKGYNIVLFMLESFSYEHSGYANPGLYARGESYTPFLDSLMRQGYLFRRGYANGRKSIEALPSVLSSIPSFKTPFVLMPQSLGDTRGLGTLLHDEGYSTWFFNGSEARSMGFVAYARLAGLHNIRTREDYEAARGTSDFDNYWGIWDAPFLQYMEAELNRAPQPFFSAVFTLSSHHPFVVPESYARTLPEGRTKIHRPVAYTDRALQEFFAAAQEESWFQKTLFVFVADHVSSETFSPVTDTPTGNMHITYFFYTPDGSLRGDDPQVAQQIDLMPTLLGLTGYRQPYFAFGRDLFGTPPSQGFAIDYLNESFQWIGDSTVLLFDGKQPTHLFNLRRDPLEQHNLLERGVAPDSLELLRMKAFLQSYYTRLSQRRYVAE